MHGYPCIFNIRKIVEKFNHFKKIVYNTPIIS